MWDREKIDNFIVNVSVGIMAGMTVLVLLAVAAALMGYDLPPYIVHGGSCDASN